MSCIPQPSLTCRAPRVRLANFTPAVLRFEDGGCTTGSLELISVTGGLLCLSKPLDRGSRVKLMFLSERGPVLAAAEILSPLSWTRQPFRFLALSCDDQRRLQTTTQGSLNPATSIQLLDSCRMDDSEQQWIEKYRAAITHRSPPQRRIIKVVLAAITLATLGLGGAVYLFTHL